MSQVVAQVENPAETPIRRDIWRAATAAYLGIEKSEVTKEQRRDFKSAACVYIYMDIVPDNMITRALRSAGFKLSEKTAEQVQAEYIKKRDESYRNPTVEDLRVRLGFLSRAEFVGFRVEGGK